MKRSPMKNRTTALARKGPLRRKTPLRRFNPKRRAAAQARNFGERGAAIRAMACLATKTPCRGRVHAAHVVARGMGGVKGSRRDLAPLCEHHHHAASEARTSQRAAFEATHEINLFTEAARIAVELDEKGYP
jgi:hypothetical protein